MSDHEMIPLRDMQSMATAMAKSGLFGKNPEQMLSLMLIAQAEGLHPARAAMEYDIIQGRPALKSQSAMARFQEAGGSVEWKIRTEAEATAIFRHPRGGEVPVTWNMDRAKLMGLDVKDNWKKQPGIMLQWRTVAEGVRACYPACLNRMYLVEEVQDMPPVRKPRNITDEKVEFIDVKPAADPAQSAQELPAEQAPDEPREQTPLAEHLKEKEVLRERFAAVCESVKLMPMPEGVTVAQKIAEMRAEVGKNRGNLPSLRFLIERYEAEVAAGVPA